MGYMEWGPNYYAINFEKIVRVFNELDDAEAAPIRISRDLLWNRVLESDLFSLHEIMDSLNHE